VLVLLLFAFFCLFDFTLYFDLCFPVGLHFSVLSVTTHQLYSVCAGHLHLFVILVIPYVTFVVVLKYSYSNSRHVGEDILQHYCLLSVLVLFSH
jgi:hypothetical protein